MHKAGGIIAIIAGIFGIFAAGFTLLFGGVASALKADGGSTVVALGWGGVVFSFLTIIFGAMALSRVRWAGIGIIICAIAGAILGGTLVAVFMVLSLIGGVLTLFAKTPNRAIQAPMHDTSIATPLPSTQSVSTVSNEALHQSTFPHAITATRPKKTQTLLIVSGMFILMLLAGTIAYFAGVKQKDTSPNGANQTVSSTVQKSTIAQSETTRNIKTETPQRDEAGLRKCLYNAGDRTPPYSFALSGITLVEKNACDDWLKTNPLVDVFVETKSVEGRDGKYLIKSTDNLLQESTINFNLHVITDTDEEKYIAENLKTFTRIKARGVLIYEKGAKEFKLNPAYLVGPAKPRQPARTLAFCMNYVHQIAQQTFYR
ncbi:MAG: hypothetical protein Q7K57_12580 [Burkholderiaceae bacterium]|nr:hypothetical protein [Burkholderiaceae bacterium]